MGALIGVYFGRLPAAALSPTVTALVGGVGLLALILGGARAIWGLIARLREAEQEVKEPVPLPRG